MGNFGIRSRLCSGDGRYCILEVFEVFCSHGSIFWCVYESLREGGARDDAWMDLSSRVLCADWSDMQDDKYFGMESWICHLSGLSLHTGAVPANNSRDVPGEYLRGWWFYASFRGENCERLEESAYYLSDVVYLRSFIHQR
ncbi:unnamed protein product [Calypogeia fissa]